MKKSIIIVSVILLSIATGIGLLNKTNSVEMSVDDFFLENIEALSALENIGGKWVIVEKIPCASSASEIRLDCSYVNCTQCDKPQPGKAGELTGTCTIVRPIDLN